MFGAPEANRYEMLVLWTVWLCAAVLLIGAIGAPHWPGETPRLVRRALALVAVLVPAAWEVFSPSRNGIEGAARLVFVWPGAALALICFAVWSRRA